MNLKFNLKFYKRYFIKVLINKLVNLLIFLSIVLILILLILIYLYFFNYNSNDLINIVDITDVSKDNNYNRTNNILKQELNKFMDLFRNKNYKFGVFINMNEYLYPLYRSVNTKKSPVVNELNNFYYSMYNENTILRNEIYYLKLQVSEFESIGTLSIQVMSEFNKFWGEFQNYLKT